MTWGGRHTLVTLEWDIYIDDMGRGTFTLMSWGGGHTLVPLKGDIYIVVMGGDPHIGDVGRDIHSEMGGVTHTGGRKRDSCVGDVGRDIHGDMGGDTHTGDVGRGTFMLEMWEGTFPMQRQGTLMLGGDTHIDDVGRDIHDDMGEGHTLVPWEGGHGDMERDIPDAKGGDTHSDMGEGHSCW